MEKLSPMPKSSKKALIERLREDTVAVFEQMTHLHQWIDHKRIAKSPGLILGRSGTGKTKACKAYCLQGRNPEDFYGEVNPALYILPAQGWDSKDLFREVLKQRDCYERASAANLRDLAFQVFANNVEVLFIDEANRLRPKTFADVRDISDVLKVSVILVGTEEQLVPVVKRDEQLYGRFRSTYRLEPIPHQGLQNVVEIWERDVLALPESSDLTSESSLELIQSAVGSQEDGYSIGLIDRLLREAAIQSLEAGFLSVNRDILAQLVEEYSIQPPTST